MRLGFGLSPAVISAYFRIVEAVNADNVRANSETVYANAFENDFNQVYTALTAKGVQVAAIDFGTGPNTGDTVRQAFTKLQNAIDAIEAPAAPAMSFSSNSVTTTEANSGSKVVNLTLNITRNGVTGSIPVSLNWGGTASKGTDYDGPSSVTVASSSSQVTVPVTVYGDPTVEPNETVLITATLASYSVTASATLNISNDDVAPTPDPVILRSVSAYGTVPATSQSSSSADNIQASSRIEDYVASETPTLGVQAQNGHAFEQVQRHCLEINGVTYPLTFNGQPTVTLQPGEVRNSDLLSAADVGLTGNFPRGARLHRRSDAIMQGLTSGWRIPRNRTDGQGETCKLGPIRDAAILSGPLVTPTGGSTASGPVGCATCLIGNPVANSNRAVLAGGSSTLSGFGDADWPKPGYAGPLGRAIFDGFKDPLPTSFIANPGVNESYFMNNNIATHPAHLALYDDLVNCFLTNDFVTATETYANYKVMWNLGKANGLKTAQLMMPMDTSSTDNWTTAAGQTPVSKYAIGGERDKINDMYLAGVGTDMDYVVDYRVEYEDPNNRSIWMTDGVTPKYRSDDGKHMSPLGHQVTGRHWRNSRLARPKVGSGIGRSPTATTIIAAENFTRVSKPSANTTWAPSVACVVPNKPNRMLVVITSVRRSANSNSNFTSMKYGGVDMVRVRQDHYLTGASSMTNEVWVMLNPPAGEALIEGQAGNVNVTGNLTAFTLINVAQTLPTGGSSVGGHGGVLRLPSDTPNVVKGQLMISVTSMDSNDSAAFMGSVKQHVAASSSTRQVIDLGPVGETTTFKGGSYFPTEPNAIAIYTGIPVSPVS